MLTPLNKVVVGKAFSDKDVREARLTLDPGEYTVDALLRFKGTMRVGRDYFSDFPAKIDVWGLLAVVLSKLPGHVVKAFIQEYLPRAEYFNGVGMLIKMQSDEAIRILKATTNTPCKGRVTAKVVLETQNDLSRFLCHLEPEKPKRAPRVVVDAPPAATSGLFDDLLPKPGVSDAQQRNGEATGIAPAARSTATGKRSSRKPARRRAPGASRQKSKAGAGTRSKATPAGGVRQ